MSAGRISEHTEESQGEEHVLGTCPPLGIFVRIAAIKRPLPQIISNSVENRYSYPSLTLAPWATRPGVPQRDWDMDSLQRRVLLRASLSHPTAPPCYDGMSVNATTELHVPHAGAICCGIFAQPLILTEADDP